MRYGLFSDVHGNLPALESIIRAFRSENVDQFFCGGDIVGYGASPRECIDVLRNLPALCIAGNHDWAVLGKINTAFFNPVAKTAIDWTRDHLLADDCGYLDGLALFYKNKDFVLVHGSLNTPERFHYLFEADDAKETFDSLDRAVCFVGHTHVAGVFAEKDGRIWSLPAIDFKMEKGCRYIVNLGSVGQPRDNDYRAGFCLFDSQAKAVFFQRADYDVAKAQGQIRDSGLPEFLASRLSAGQ